MPSLGVSSVVSPAFVSAHRWAIATRMTWDRDPMPQMRCRPCIRVLAASSMFTEITFCWFRMRFRLLTTQHLVQFRTDPRQADLEQLERHRVPAQRSVNGEPLGVMRAA